MAGRGDLRPHDATMEFWIGLQASVNSINDLMYIYINVTQQWTCDLGMIPMILTSYHPFIVIWKIVNWVYQIRRWETFWNGKRSDFLSPNSFQSMGGIPAWW